jgi:hypothetical protein
VDNAIDTVNTAALCNAISGLNAEQSYMPRENEDGLVVRVAPGTTDQLQMLRIRWSDHPGVWARNGAMSDLPIPNDQGLHESTFVRFFAANVVAVDVNRSGPWPTSLRDYLRDRLPEQYRNLQMIQIPDRTALERLNRITTVSKLQLQLSNATLAQVAQPDHDYLNVLRNTIQIGDAGILEVVWKRIGRQAHLNAAALKAMVQYFIENANNLDDKAQIIMQGSDRHGHPESFSLKRDYVTAEAKIARGANRRIDPTDAFDKLRLAFNTARQRIPPQTFLQQ